MDLSSTVAEVQQTDSSSPSSLQPRPGDAATFVNSKLTTKATRRIRGEIACAECRRLKIRCDRIVPCSTCVKRGCGALCPNGTIPPGEGSRFVLAASDHLQHNITKMEARMRALEDALAIVHASESDHPHPLLTSTKDHEHEMQEQPILKPIAEEKAAPVSLTDALGTLYLDSQGVSRFFGPTGGSESLLISSSPAQRKATGPVLQELDTTYLSSDINNCYQSFPFTPPNVFASSVQPDVESFLPSMERAITLCDTFLEHLSWMFHIVSRHALVNELIPVIYKQTRAPYGPHDLALLLIVLGIGSLVDLNLPPYNLEAQHYYHLSRATMALQPVLGAQSIVTIKVLHLMSIYNGMSGKETNLEQSYMLLDLAGQVAHGIGFHFDPSMWGFEGRDAYDRRVYFWNLLAAVLWQSLVVGRPPSLMLSFINCRIPSAEEEEIFQEGEVPLGFGIWGFRASAECLIPLVDAVLAAKPPTYDTIMTLDRKIRNLFSTQRAENSLSNTDTRTALSMRIFVRSHYQDLMLLFLHRAHFAQAMSEHPENPMSSPYSHSVQAAYTSACVVLQDTRAQFTKNPLLCTRIWRMWSLAFSAAVIVGTVAVRGIHLNLKPPPLGEFEASFKMFTSAAETSNRAAKALPVLSIMLQKAHQAHRYYHEQGKPAPSQGIDVDEMAYFGGRTAVIKQEESTPVLTPSQADGKLASQHPIAPIATLASIQATQTQTRQGIINPPNTLPTLSMPISNPALIYAAGSVSSYQYPGQSTVHQSSSRSEASLLTMPISTPTSVTAQSTQQYPRRQQQRTSPESQRPIQTFADLSGGWNGLFHEVSGPQHSAYSYLSGHGPTSHQHSGTGPGWRAQGASSNHPHSYTPLRSDTLMLDDRWASFMNYGVLEEPTR